MARVVMIIGNGNIESGFANSIDAADVVIRFNDCRTLGASGFKTDIVAVCNTGRPAKRMLGETGWQTNPAVLAAASIWCVRDPAKFAALRQPLAVTHPELDDFCDDYTDGFADFTKRTGKNLHIVPGATHDRLDRELDAFHPEPYVVPSTGLVALAEFLAHFSKPADRITLAGFGHQGWEWHPWQAERHWIESRIAEGKLNRILEQTPGRSASGA